MDCRPTQIIAAFKALKWKRESAREVADRFGGAKRLIELSEDVHRALRGWSTPILLDDIAHCLRKAGERAGAD